MVGRAGRRPEQPLRPLLRHQLGPSPGAWTRDGPPPGPAARGGAGAATGSADRRRRRGRRLPRRQAAALARDPSERARGHRAGRSRRADPRRGVRRGADRSQRRAGPTSRGGRRGRGLGPDRGSGAVEPRPRRPARAAGRSELRTDRLARGGYGDELSQLLRHHLAGRGAGRGPRGGGRHPRAGRLAARSGRRGWGPGRPRGRSAPAPGLPGADARATPRSRHLGREDPHRRRGASRRLGGRRHHRLRVRRPRRRAVHRPGRLGGTAPELGRGHRAPRRLRGDRPAGQAPGDGLDAPPQRGSAGAHAGRGLRRPGPGGAVRRA